MTISRSNIESLVEQGHIHMSAYDRTSQKHLFKTNVSSDDEVRSKLKSLQSHPKGKELGVSVQNTKTGETWSGKPHHNFPGFG
jgi:hypothetical protein